MGARLRVFLKQEEDRTLFELRAATTVPQKVKDRAQVIRLNAQGWYVEKIAAHFKWTEPTVREVLHRWVEMGLGGLWSAPGRGTKPNWEESDIVYLEECLKNEPRRYNSRQLAQKLEQERGVKLSPDRLRRILKKKKSCWKRARPSHKGKQDPLRREIKQADLEMLELAAAAGEIDLKYLDESGFCLWSSSGYTYYPRGEQKRLEQTFTKGSKTEHCRFATAVYQFRLRFSCGECRQSFIHHPNAK